MRESEKNIRKERKTEKKKKKGTKIVYETINMWDRAEIRITKINDKHLETDGRQELFLKGKRMRQQNKVEWRGKANKKGETDVVKIEHPCSSLPILIQFFLMFYNDKPVDWLLDHVVTTKICKLDQVTSGGKI